MRVSHGSSFVNLNRKNNVNFGHKITLDIGASDPRGSCKVSCESDNSEELFHEKKFVNDKITGFKDSDDFLGKVSKIVNQANDKAVAEFKKQGKAPEKLSALALFVPGEVRNNVAIRLANIRDKSNEGLEGINFESLRSSLNNISSNLKIKSLKDLAGAGLSLAEKFSHSPDYAGKFKRNFYGVGVMTGGGFGSVNMKVHDGSDLVVETSESSHDLAIDKNGEVKRLGVIGATVKGIIGNYAESLGITDKNDKNILIKTGNARLATQKNIKLDSEKDKKAISLLTSKGLYDFEAIKDGKTNLKVKDVNKFAAARRAAIAQYADAVAQHAITKINENADVLVLTGPLALGLSNTIQQNKEDFTIDKISDLKNVHDMDGNSVKNPTTLAELVTAKIDKYIADDKTCSALRKASGFKVISNDKFAIKGNTGGGKLLLDDNTIVGNGWVQIPLALYDKDEEADKGEEIIEIDPSVYAISNALRSFSQKEVPRGKVLAPVFNDKAPIGYWTRNNKLLRRQFVSLKSLKGMHFPGGTSGKNPRPSAGARVMHIG